VGEPGRTVLAAGVGPPGEGMGRPSQQLKRDGQAIGVDVILAHGEVDGELFLECCWCDWRVAINRDSRLGIFDALSSWGRHLGRCGPMGALVRGSNGWYQTPSDR